MAGMSGTGGVEVHTPQLWRRSPELQPTREFLVAGIGDEAGAAAGSKERLVRLVMGSLSVVDWVRSQWLLGLFILSIGMAYYHPVSADMATSAWTRVLVLVSFTLSGASFPDVDRGATLRFMGPAITMFIMSFLFSPIVGVGVYMTLRSSSETNYLAVGLMCTFCLPPSVILSVAAVRSSQGSEALSQYLSAVGSVCGVVLSPLLMLACMSLSHATKFPSTAEMMLFHATVIGPFFCGVIAQKVFGWVAHRRIAGEDRDVLRLNKAELACSELCNGSLVYWRQRTIQLNNLVLLLVNYCMFSNFFVQSVASSSLTWRGVGLISLVELTLYAATCLVGWLLASLIACTPEDRIALFFTFVTKSEVLVVPIILHLFQENRQAAVILLPSLMYHLIQAFAAGVLSFPLRRWRYQYNCRPGTTLLPLRLSRVNRVPATKS
ncbi:uncharacterized protein Tco025E_06299 [Trypanosoma conorhini]|uniref:Uncharacterized protein n=1 Tax=Trypanosoma conorhini TaxID=83891 RepID=A0A3R7NWW6_9TRYP|nr:uncharacterized protein Tco025E_06299 [Trypanosoma conorhini]RNF13109.1 hypothetical protein Tco025E_06299 [Trypanosoma conorhini]